MFCALVSLDAASKPFTFISLVVMLLTEASVKKSDDIKKDQIYHPSPLRTVTHDAPWSFLLQLKRETFCVMRKATWQFYVFEVFLSLDWYY